MSKEIVLGRCVILNGESEIVGHAKSVTLTTETEERVQKAAEEIRERGRVAGARLRELNAELARLESITRERNRRRKL